MQYKDCYKWGVEQLETAGVPEAGLDARLLLEYVCGTTRNDLLVHGEREVAEDMVRKYQEKIGLRATRIPLQHITGEQEFMGLSFLVNEHVLIPRQDTEILVEQVLKVLKPGMRILDMCTGSGCILISLLALSKECMGTGVDLSAKALAVAEKNSVRLLGVTGNGDSTGGILKNGGGKVSWLQSDLFENVAGDYDMIVSNPPYIRRDVIRGLMPEVREHEPMMALDGTEDGLFFYRKIVSQVADFLKPGGYLFFEIGHDQGREVEILLKDNKFTEVKVIQDYAGQDRVVCGRREE